MTTTAPKSGGVLCVGRVYADLLFHDMPRLPSLGTEVFAEGLRICPGGGAFITAAYLAALGRRAEMATGLAFGPLDGAMRDQIAEAHVGTTLCQTVQTDAPQLTVAMTGGHDRAFLTKRAGPSAVLPDAAQLRALGLGHIHVGELRTLADHPQLITLARDAGLTLSADCAWEDTLPEGAGDLIAQLDVFLPSASEMRRLQALGLGPVPAPLTVVKQGGDGATAFQADGSAITATAQPRAVTDATGAGDAFNAGFLDAWLRSAPIAECLAAGNICGGAAIEYVGGTGGTAVLLNARTAPVGRSARS